MKSAKITCPRCESEEFCVIFSVREIWSIDQDGTLGDKQDTFECDDPAPRIHLRQLW